MSLSFPSLPRIQAHLEDLRLQEEDVRNLLSRPEPKPGVHEQLRLVLKRIGDERAGLEISFLKEFSAPVRQ